MNEERTIAIRPPAWLPIFVVLLAGGFYLGGKYVETRDREEPATISISGEGRVFAAPDIAEMSFGVQTGRQKTHKEAKRILEEKMDAAFKAVKALGIPEKDIRTEYLSIRPVYDWTERGQVFRGFEASQSLRVKVRDLDKVSEVLDAAVEAGANQAGDVTFTVDEPEGKRAEARMKAIVQAKEKAEALAKELGVRLGELKGFSEGGGFPPPVFMRAEARGMGGDVMEKSIPLPAGEQEITVQVTLTYEVE